MFKRLEEKDRDALFEYLMPEKEVNTFIIGDIEAFGFDEKDVWVAANINENNTYDSVALYFRRNMVVYAKEGFDAKALADFIKSHPDVGLINGISRVVELIVPYLEEFTERQYMFCSCQKEKYVPINNNPAVLIRPEDAYKVAMLENSIEEFQSYTERSVQDRGETLAKDIEEGKSICSGVFQDGKLVSSAGISAINSLGAMAVGVCTLPDFRGQGFATLSLKKIQQIAFEEKGLSFISLFFDNPVAGRIYITSGFRITGHYSMLYRKKNEAKD